jgi:protein phosphatase 1 regulatory subunit 42
MLLTCPCCRVSGIALLLQDIPSLVARFNNKRWDKFNSEKVCNISYGRIQGRAALISHFQNSSLMHEDKRCRPVLFISEGPDAGEPEPFPMGVHVRPRAGASAAGSSGSLAGSQTGGLTAGVAGGSSSGAGQGEGVGRVGSSGSLPGSRNSSSAALTADGAAGGSSEGQAGSSDVTAAAAAAAAPPKGPPGL